MHHSLNPDSPLSNRINDLMDLARAGELRCNTTAALVASPPLKALLLLRGAEHGKEAAALNDLVVELRGTPHAGDADALRADPLWQTPPTLTASEAQLLDLCIQAQAADQARFDAAQALPDLPPHALRLLQQCSESAQRWAGQLAGQRQQLTVSHAAPHAPAHPA